MTTIEKRMVKLSMNEEFDPLDSRRFKFEDAKTGEMIDNITGFCLQAKVGGVPHLTVETLPDDLDVSPMVLEAEIKKQPSQRFVHAGGRNWVDAAWLAREIRDNGTMCSSGGAKYVAHDFSDELLKHWETVETDPDAGRNKET